MPNLEPVEEKDLDLKNKFVEKPEAVISGEKSSPELAPNPEANRERVEGLAEKDQAYSKILSKVKTTQPADENAVLSDAATTNLATDAESKVEKLIQLAMQKGVVHAVKVAKHLEDNYTLDEFHDKLLADELHDALIKKGLIEEL